jgi:hypothetical protein
MVNCNWLSVPDFSDFSDALYYSRAYRIKGDSSYWRCEAFASFLAFYGVVLVAWFGIQEIALLNPSDAFLGVSVVKGGLCVNLTCAALYCSVTAPVACKQTPVHLKQMESAEFCSPNPGCDWNVEVLSDASFENRSTCLAIANPQVDEQATYFPLLENMKRQFVDITKYVNTQSGLVVIDYSIALRMRSQQMSSCGAALSESMKTNTRCGSYSMFLSNTIYESLSKKRYTSDLAVMVFFIMTSCLTVVAIFWMLLSSYRNAKTLETALQRTHND